MASERRSARSNGQSGCFSSFCKAAYRYAILGAGRQGTAGAYDLARFGAAERITMLDVDEARAQAAAARLNRLVGRKVAEAKRLKPTEAGMAAAFKGHHAVLCAAPFTVLLEATEAALRAGVHICDLGGHTETVFKQLRLHKAFDRAMLSAVPDCGLAPGAGNLLAVHAVELLEARRVKPREVRIYCGGLPQKPQGPLDYMLVFSIHGLINEYQGHAEYLRKGVVEKVPALSELETIHLPKPLGTCEAFVTSGGTSTAPWNLQGKLRTYEYKTIRYPGHGAKVRLLRDLGLFGDTPLNYRDGRRVVPQEFFGQLAAPRLTFPGELDLVVMRIVARGKERTRGGQEVEAVLDWLDLADPQTGFSAMERTTGFSAAIVAARLAAHGVAPGVHPMEQALPAGEFVAELARRGMKVKERVGAVAKKRKGR